MTKCRTTSRVASSGVRRGAAGGYQSVVSQQWYLPYGAVRHAINTMPTQRTYTGQYTEAPGLGSLMFYNVRYYSPALSRFVSADTLVPEPGNPQALNRYAYVYNAPLKYTDPSGHDVMIVGGLNADSYSNPLEYKAWIMAYKGWGEAEWVDYYARWMDPESNRATIMAETGIHFFTRAAGQVNDELLQQLAYELRGMKDITLIGHSWGANVTMNYLSRQGALTDAPRVGQFISIKPPTEGLYQGSAGGAEPGPPFYRNPNCIVSSYLRRLGPTDATLVNVYSTWDPISSNSYIDGAINFTSNDRQVGLYAAVTHGNAPALATSALLAVGAGHDHNSSMMVRGD